MFDFFKKIAGFIKKAKGVVIPTLLLTLIAVVMTGALAGTNALTESKIKKMNEEIQTQARMKVIDADSFDTKTANVNGEDIEFAIAIKDGKEVGGVYTVNATGKSSGLMVMVGINGDGTIAGVEITEQNETAGYVDKVINAGFLKSFKQKPVEDSFVVGQDIDAVSQATKTVEGINDGVKTAIEYFKKTWNKAD